MTKQQIAACQNSSCVTIFKEMYRKASKHQRAMMRAWMQRVIDGTDGTP